MTNGVLDAATVNALATAVENNLGVILTGLLPVAGILLAINYFIRLARRVVR